MGSFSMLSGSGPSPYPWNTNFARYSLQIPGHQLRMINSIPEWETQAKESSNFHDTELSLETENYSISQVQNSVKELGHPNNSLQAQNISKDIKELNSVFNGCEQVVLSRLPRLKRSSSVPSIKVSASGCSLHTSKSETNNTDSLFKMSSQPIFSRKYSPEENHLDETYIAKDNKIPKTIPCLDAPTERKIEKLSDRIVSHPFLMTAKVPGVKNSPQTKAHNFKKHEDNLIKVLKKVRLLEKRFSPSKDTAKGIDSDSILASEKSSTISQQLHSIVNASTSQKGDFFLDKDKHLNNATKSLKEVLLTENIQASQRNVENGQSIIVPSNSKNVLIDKVVEEQAEESFLSQPIPCGQPPKSDILSSNIVSRIKNKVDEPLSKKIQNETSSAPVQISSRNHWNGPEVGELDRNESSGKRKRKNKNEKSSKKIHCSRKPCAAIHFTLDQVRNMIDIVKEFNL